jgi:hypothetical protein
MSTYTIQLTDDERSIVLSALTVMIGEVALNPEQETSILALKDRILSLPPDPDSPTQGAGATASRQQSRVRYAP